MRDPKGISYQLSQLMKRWIIVLLLSLSCGLGALLVVKSDSIPKAPSEVLVIPFRTIATKSAGWQALVEAKVDGKVVPLTLDTGSDISCLPQEFKKRLQVLSENVMSDSNGRRKVFRVGPALFSLNGYDLGQHDFHIQGDYILPTYGREIWHTTIPVLGLNILARYRIRLDGPAETMTLASDAKPLEGSDWVEYHGFFDTPHTIIDAYTHDDRVVSVFLDTGYARSRLCKSYATQGAMPLHLKIGDVIVRFADAELLDGAHDLEVQNAKGEKIVVHASLGWDVLRHFTYDISPQNKKLRLVPASK